MAKNRRRKLGPEITVPSAVPPAMDWHHSLGAADLSARRARIVLYSHDTLGLGHIRRNLGIAKALTELEPAPTILLISGIREATAFEMPPGVDCLTLPALQKDSAGHYQPRALDISRQHLISLRAQAIRAAVQTFDPHVLIVDKVPLGIYQELKPTLQMLHKTGHTRCILGLRDILDDPETVYREWHLAGHDLTVQTFYDSVWVYGDPTVYNPIQAYDFPSQTAAKVRFTGYLGRPTPSPATMGTKTALLSSLELPAGRLVLCLVGGGQDGFRLAQAFAQAQLPPATNAVLITGPFMPPDARQQLHALTSHCRRKRILTFVPRPEDLLWHADSVVAMGGYNTICEILSCQKRALIVPRVAPRQEQLIRAHRLQELGLADMLHPADLTPGAISEWLMQQTTPVTRPHIAIDLEGLERLPTLLSEILTLPAKTFNLSQEIYYAYQ